MRVHTYCSESDHTEFTRLRRKRWTGWQFLVSGEWANSPMNQGYCSFNISSTANKQYWAILSEGFPRRIVAVAHVPDDTPTEDIAAEMLKAVRDGGGNFIGVVGSHGDIDIDRFWNRYINPN